MNLSTLSPEIIVFIAVLVLFGIAVFAFTALSSPSAKMRKRAQGLKRRGTHAAKPTSEESTGSLRKVEGDTSLPLLTAIASRMPSIKLLRNRLAQAGLAMTAERYLAYNGLLFAFAAITVFFTTHKPPALALLIGIIIGIGLPHLIVGIRITRRKKAFLLLFPDGIDLIVRGLKAGLPVTESIKMVSKEIADPVGSLFQRIADKMALGIPLERTLHETAEKFRITEFDFFVTSIVLQRETGGNLSEILSNLSEALRQRQMMRMKIKAMSSEAKASMYIIGALPFMVVGALLITSPNYLSPLFSDFRGNIALGIACCMLVSGVFIMMRMTKFEI
ncbi:MAG: type II secretion system F family protein [Rickettsiales bacterium]